MNYSLCQRCHKANVNSWQMQQAEFHVGRIEHWRIQLCPRCVDIIEAALLSALKADPVLPTAKEEISSTSGETLPDTAPGGTSCEMPSYASGTETPHEKEP